MLTKDHLDGNVMASDTVDPAEIARFTSLAKEWWDPNGKFGAIHKFNPVRRDYILNVISEHYGRNLAGGRALVGLEILDVGCGAGLLCEPLAEQGAHVVGVDATARNLDVARLHASEQSLPIDYCYWFAEHVREKGERFDVVLNTEVVEHVANPDQLLADCAALAKPGGIMVVATLNRTLRAFLLAIIGAEYISRWLPKGTHDWRRFLRPKEISDMLGRHGLKTHEIQGVSFNPWANRWRLSDDDSVNYMLLAGKEG
jgi:2-polyprenyl-6-hydroxyphenyl methylase/3-demethylubiquinone-9 3-methyltransferase